MKVLRVETEVLANVTCLHIGNAQSADDCAGIREYLLRYGNVLGQGKIKELQRKHYKYINNYNYSSFYRMKLGQNPFDDTVSNTAAAAAVRLDRSLTGQRQIGAHFDVKKVATFSTDHLTSSKLANV